MHDASGEGPAERIKRLEAERQARCEKLYDIYDSVVIVAGSRSFKDYALFESVMNRWRIDYAKSLGAMWCFMSGMAREGADELILRYAKKTGEHVEPMPALWNEYKALDRVKIAGMKRNHEMGDVASHLVAFWDGFSKGTKDMIDYATDQGLHVVKVMVSPTGV